MNYFLIILFINFILILYLIYKITFGLNNEKFDSVNDYYQQDINSINNMGKYSKSLLDNNDTLSLSPNNITINDLNVNSATIKNNLTNTKLKGIIVIWSGNSINFPIGWTLCDGTNGTPDLRSQFIIGAGLDKYSTSSSYFKLGDKGGAETVTLNGEQIPQHSHKFNNNSPLINNGNIPGTSRYKFHCSDIGSNCSGNLSYITNSSSQTGGNGAHNNMPPYYALCYIMKL
jgi:microcystin-dependent protein